jgi:hypothetical protein
MVNHAAAISFPNLTCRTAAIILYGVNKYDWKTAEFLNNNSLFHRNNYTSYKTLINILIIDSRSYFFTMGDL